MTTIIIAIITIIITTILTITDPLSININNNNDT
jgi:hypothetical protein